MSDKKQNQSSESQNSTTENSTTQNVNTTRPLTNSSIITLNDDFNIDNCK
ncbi:hypothetical protein [Lutibacter sp.]|nr:hypothetical protein [Lutibacter sp.]MDP3314333.1 hypothetical protein [Lutibacter sp.]